MFRAIEKDFNQAIKKYCDFLNFHYFLSSEYPQYNLQEIYLDNESRQVNLQNIGNEMVRIINQLPSPNTNASATFKLNLLSSIKDSYQAANLNLPDQINSALNQARSTYMMNAENGILALTSSSLFYYTFNFFNNLYNQPRLEDDEYYDATATSNTTISLCLFCALATGYWASRGFRTDLYNHPHDSSPSQYILRDFKNTLDQTLNQPDIEQALTLS